MKKRSGPTRKERITVYISPYLYNEIKEMVDSGDFSSESDIGYQALSKFVTDYMSRRKKRR